MTIPKAVLLDVDGTLIDSNDAHARAFVEAAEALGIPSPPLRVVREMIGMGGDKLIPKAFGAEHGSRRGKALDERKGEIFRQKYLPTLRPTPGARELVERFGAEGLRRVVATSANEEDLKLLLRVAGIEDLVDDCTSADDVDESKPEPDLVHAALRLAEVGPEEAIMLGDTPYDVEAATRAGVAIVAVRTGGWSDAALSGAIRVYATPADILNDYPASPFV